MTVKVEHCDVCGEQHEALYVHSKCHPAAPTWVILTAHDYMRIECSECGQEIMKLSINYGS